MLPQREQDGQFDTFETWVSKATSWIGGTNPLCADAKDRICKSGKDMMLARDENAFPVRFWYGEGDLTPKQHKQSKRDYQAAMKLHYPWRYK